MRARHGGLPKIWPVVRCRFILRTDADLAASRLATTGKYFVNRILDSSVPFESAVPIQYKSRNVGFCRYDTTDVRPPTDNALYFTSDTLPPDLADPDDAQPTWRTNSSSTA